MCCNLQWKFPLRALLAEEWAIPMVKGGVCVVSSETHRNAVSHYFSFQPSNHFLVLVFLSFLGSQYTDPLKLVGHLPKNKLQDPILVCSTVFSYRHTVLSVVSSSLCHLFSQSSFLLLNVTVCLFLILYSQHLIMDMGKTVWFCRQELFCL